MADKDLLFGQPPVTGQPVNLTFGGDAAPPVVEDLTNNLVFKRPPLVGMPIQLVFGEDAAAPPATPDVTVTGELQVTGLRMGFVGRLLVRVQGTIPVTGLLFKVRTKYDINVSRPTVGQATARYQQARTAQAGAQGIYQQALPLNSGAQANWQDAQKVQALLRAAWQQAENLQSWARSSYQQAVALPTTPLMQNYQEAEKMRSGVQENYQDATRLATTPSTQRFQEGIHARSGLAGRYQDAQKLASALMQREGYAVPMGSGLGVRFQEAWPPRPGIWIRPVVPVEPGEACYDPALPAHLVFFEPHDGSLPARLIFKCDTTGPVIPEPGATVVIPTLKVYMVFNEVSLMRVEGGIEIPAPQLSLTLDMSSWTWTFNAKVPISALPLLEPVNGVPVDLEATINGTPIRLVAESIKRDRSISGRTLSLSGRGRNALLGDPYSPQVTFMSGLERTAQQLMADALTLNGVSIGWGLDFGLTDWLVPANTWSHQGTYISAVQSIAESVGGVVQPHNTAQTLRIVQKYPIPSWQWGGMNVDYELPEAVAITDSVSWENLPEYSRVFVSGTSVGVKGQITRAGTAGNLVAPMVVNSLITTASAARQAGIGILSQVGRRANVSLTMPVLSESGLILPGKSIRYVEDGKTRTGFVRSIAINADSSVGKVRQSLGLETYV